jgi:hypothetical protein
VRGLEGSESARKLAAIMLEAWSGACGPVEAAQKMGVALVRYYQLEARALAALIGAMEPRARGRTVTAAGTLRREGEKLKRLERELHRYQSLYRSAAKSLGIARTAVVSSDEKVGKKRRRQRRITRGERVARGLLPKPSETTVAETNQEGA